MINYKQAFENGNYYFDRKNYVFARYYFGMSVQCNKYRVESLYKLILIEIKDGNFLMARQMLEENLLNNTKLVLLYGLLEKIENNFGQSMMYYKECMKEPDMKDLGILSIAKLNVQTGDYIVAKNMFEDVRNNKDFFVQSTLGLVYLNMLNYNYVEANRIMKEIDVFKLSSDLRRQYKVIDYYIKYFLGELKLDDCDIDFRETYMIRRLFEDSEELLIEHIKRHANQIKRDTNGCFFEDIDLESLLSLARSKMEKVNANYFEFSDMYRFKLDFPIGYKGQNVTNDICVTTIIGTKDIITMYPIILSSEFDKEGFGTSEELKLKRLKGINMKV